MNVKVKCNTHPKPVESKHTPGPWDWKQTRGNNIYEHRVSTLHQTIADLNGSNPNNTKANARLISLAPLLPEAIELIVLILLRLEHWSKIKCECGETYVQPGRKCVFCEGQALIAKYEGGLK